VSYLAHHGILGQKWGVRRYQNADGSFTPAGKKRYGTLSSAKQIQNRLNDLDTAIQLNRKSLDQSNIARAKNKKERKKIASKIESGKLSQKKAETLVNKFISKSQRDWQKGEDAISNIKKGNTEVNRLLKKLDSEGYKVTTSKQLRASREENGAYDGSFYVADQILYYGTKYTVSR